MRPTALTLRGRIVRLEPLGAGHAPGLFAAATPDLFTVAPQGPPEWSEAGFLADIVKMNAIPAAVFFAIIYEPTGRVIGRTAYLEIRPQHRGLEIGRTWIAREHQRTGANPESKYLLLRHAFEELGAVRVQFKAGADNPQSQRAIEKLGAAPEGVLRDYLVHPETGRTRDAILYSITATQWPGLKAVLENRLGYTP